jgi:hypothetical protein
LPEFDETMHVNIDTPFHATIADRQGVGTILNDDAGRVGRLDLTPADATVTVGDRVTYRLVWTVPDGGWRSLNTIELRIGDGGSLLWVRFDEASGTLSVWNPAARTFGPSFAPGRPNVLKARGATVYLADSRVVASGPTSPEVTLVLALGFEPPAVGQDYPVEVRATNDDGAVQGFDRAATLTVTRREH